MGGGLLMARSHGRIMAAIWNDGDFIAMRGSAQRLFMFLLSQPDLSHAGLVPMRVNRWAKKAEDSTPATVRDDLAYLDERGFVVADDDTEEVLIRTFVRNDGVYKQPKVMLRMREDAQQIESPRLRAAFRAELAHLPLEELADKPGGPHGDQPSTREAVAGVVKGLLSDFSDAAEYPTERVSGGVSDTPRVRAGALPLPPTPFPQPPTDVPATPDAGKPSSQAEVVIAEPAEPAEPTTQALIAEWIDHCAARPPRNVIGQASKQVKAMLEEGIDPQRIRHGLAEWNRKGLHPSTLPSVVHELANKRPARRNNDIDWDAALAQAAALDAKNGETR